MKLVGNLKTEVEKSVDKAEAKAIIRNAGMELTDDELNMVAGGGGIGRGTGKAATHTAPGYKRCKKCGYIHNYNYLPGPGDHSCKCGNYDPNQFELINFPGSNLLNGIHY